MRLLQIILVIMFVAIIGYTAKTIHLEGWNLLPVFFGDMVKFGWPGQFNFDFLLMLVLSALWTTWRYKFSAKGFIMGALALFGGILFQSAHLLYLTTREPSIKAVLLGDRE